MSETIGFIGTGHMGAAMALRLLRAGLPLTVFDTNPAALVPLQEEGARVAASPRAVADAATIVFACLPSRRISHEVALGADGVAAGHAVQVHVETSTIGAPTAQALAEGLREKGIAFLDCPVTGGPRGAQAGTLAAMASGAPEVFERVRPVLAAMAGRVFFVGDRPGLAQICKLVNNAVSAAGMAAACEAVVTGVKAGLDATTLIEVLNAGTGRNAATEDKFPKSILPRSFDYGGPLEIVVKDLALFLEEAAKLGVPAEVGAKVAALWADAARAGNPRHDLTTLIQYIERQAGIEVKGRPEEQGQ